MQEPKRSGWFYELLFGARSAAGSMTPLSLAYAGARTQIPDAPLPSASYGAHLALVGLSRFLLPTCIFPPVAPPRSRYRHMDSQLVCLQGFEPAEKPERLSFSSS